MTTRKDFLVQSGMLAAGVVLLPSFTLLAKNPKKNLGVQLYTFRKEMTEDAVGTLKKIAALGIKQIESARSTKGLYYGLKPKEMKDVCSDLGMTLRSGHVALDENWQNTMDQAAESGQEYLICSSMPTEGQTADNYKSVAEAFNKAGEECKSRNIKFGYHNHEYEFESENGEVFYDILLNNTQPDLVHMELDLGWVVVAGKDPLDYFKRYEGRFPLWHLKDMDMVKKESTEFGKGGLNIAQMLEHKKESGLEYIFIEQEEYASTPFESMEHNMKFMKNL
ncbi:sugar phosphate isomerase/epimerase [Arenibacter sp. BSSL-BM3]|uniref:Sugar phosphate isomerase/epimerase n=1 Tax=Arenibacter arenosicollis TaxID=2762274 RepID=A0ABR7QRM0_9FLAO|nr:sugar phosphate isomerase/epimerase [Arenibacter arenosicollis]MBC8769822.1 sugar phosphate isomerase/epimerase [Arenibacter arenosicollis]